MDEYLSKGYMGFAKISSDKVNFIEEQFGSLDQFIEEFFIKGKTLETSVGSATPAAEGDYTPTKADFELALRGDSALDASGSANGTITLAAHFGHADRFPAA